MTTFGALQIGHRFFCVYTRDYIRAYEKKSLSTAYCVDALTMKRRDPKDMGIVGFTKSVAVVSVEEALR